MFSTVFTFVCLSPFPSPAPGRGRAAPTPTFTREMGSTSSQKLAGLFKGLLFSPVTHILDSTGNGDTWAVTIWIQLLSAQRNWKGLHNGQTHPTSEVWLPWPRLEKSLCRPPPPRPTDISSPKPLLAPATEKKRSTLPAPPAPL